MNNRSNAIYTTLHFNMHLNSKVYVKIVRKMLNVSSLYERNVYNLVIKRVKSESTHMLIKKFNKKEFISQQIGYNNICIPHLYLLCMHM